MVYASGELQVCPGCREETVPKIVGFCSIPCQEKVHKTIVQQNKERIIRMKGEKILNGI